MSTNTVTCISLKNKIHCHHSLVYTVWPLLFSSGTCFFKPMTLKRVVFITCILYLLLTLLIRTSFISAQQSWNLKNWKDFTTITSNYFLKIQYVLKKAMYNHLLFYTEVTFTKSRHVSEICCVLTALFQKKLQSIIWDFCMKKSKKSKSNMYKMWGPYWKLQFLIL